MRRNISSRDGIRDAWLVWNVVVSPNLNYSARVRPTLAALLAIAASRTTILSARPIVLTVRRAVDAPEMHTQNQSVSTEESSQSIWFKENHSENHQKRYRETERRTKVVKDIKNKRTLFICFEHKR